MKFHTWILLVSILWLAACQPAPGTASPATSAYADATSEPARPTPTALTPDAAPLTTPAPADQADGAGFRDRLAVADRFFVTLTGVPAPPAGQAYQGWLLGDDGTSLSTGILSLAADGSAALTWDSPTSENLLSRYGRFQVTLEPAAGSASPTGRVVFAGGLEGAALTNARRLLVKNDGQPATPRDTAFALGLVAQTDLAAQHMKNSLNAAAIGAQAEMRGHLEHIINILEGANGPRFGDHDGNGTAENPGDGFGVMGYSEQIAVILAGQASVVEATASLQAQSAAIQDKCLEILALDDLAAAAAQISQAEKLIDEFQTDLVAGLYLAAQDSVRFEVTPLE